MDVYQNYLRDLGGLIRGLALEARRERDAARGSPEEQYRTGYLMAFHTVVSLLLQQAEAFQIPLDELQLAEMNPEDELL